MESPKKIREWGLSLDFDPLKAFVNLEDLSVTENVENLGAKLFIETLGDNATHFAASITESNLEKDSLRDSEGRLIAKHLSAPQIEKRDPILLAEDPE